jgi:hypothetical protein
MRRIISACPALQLLSVVNSLQDAAGVQELLRLPQCNNLFIGGTALGDGEAAILAQLTQLTQLMWRDSAQLTDVGLEKLTALTCLCDCACPTL